MIEEGMVSDVLSESYNDEDGDLMPDIDLIEEYASQWFDFRLAE